MPNETAKTARPRTTASLLTRVPGASRVGGRARRAAIPSSSGPGWGARRVLRSSAHDRRGSRRSPPRPRQRQVRLSCVASVDQVQTRMDDRVLLYLPFMPADRDVEVALHFVELVVCVTEVELGR